MDVKIYQITYNSCTTGTNKKVHADKHNAWKHNASKHNARKHNASWNMTQTCTCKARHGSRTIANVWMLMPHAGIMKCKQNGC